MEEQYITIRIRTSGEKCRLTDEEIRRWYDSAMRSAMNPACGTPEITVEVQRKDLA